MVNKVHVKNNNDSYKLLNGKYPATIQREQRIKNNKTLAIIVLNLPIFVSGFVSVKKVKLTQ